MVGREQQQQQHEQSLSLAHGLVRGTFVPELHQLICSDGTVLPATPAPVLQRWFQQHPEQAAAAQIWRVYPRSTREGLALFVIGAESAATPADAARLRRGIDRFNISGVLVNQRTDQSRTGAVVVVRVTRNVPRPANRRARHPNWKPHLIWLRGGLRPTSKYKGAFVNLLAKRVGKELRLVGVRSSGQRPPEPIVFGWPYFEWPWPFTGKSAEITSWCRSWWGGGRQRFIDSAEFQPMMPRVPEGLLSSRDRKPPFFCADCPAAEAVMLQRLDRFLEMQKLLIQRFLLPQQRRVQELQEQAAGDVHAPMQQQLISRLQTESDRARLVVLRLRRTLERMDNSTKEALFEATGLPFMLEEQLDGYEAATYLVAPPAADAAAAPKVEWFGMPVYQPDLRSRQRVQITGKLKQIVLSKLPDWYNQPAITSGEAPSAPTPTQKDYGMSQQLLEIGEMIATGHVDATICSRYGLLAGDLRVAAKRLVDRGWAGDRGLIPETVDAIEETGVRSAAMRQVLRHHIRTSKGLTLHGRASRGHNPL